MIAPIHSPSLQFEGIFSRKSKRKKIKQADPAARVQLNELKEILDNLPNPSRTLLTFPNILHLDPGKEITLRDVDKSSIHCRVLWKPDVQPPKIDSIILSSGKRLSIHDGQELVLFPSSTATSEYGIAIVRDRDNQEVYNALLTRLNDILRYCIACDSPSRVRKIYEKEKTLKTPWR